MYCKGLALTFFASPGVTELEFSGFSLTATQQSQKNPSESYRKGGYGESADRHGRRIQLIKERDTNDKKISTRGLRSAPFLPPHTIVVYCLLRAFVGSLPLQGLVERRMQNVQSSNELTIACASTHARIVAWSSGSSGISISGGSTSLRRCRMTLAHNSSGVAPLGEAKTTRTNTAVRADHAFKVFEAGGPLLVGVVQGTSERRNHQPRLEQMLCRVRLVVRQSASKYYPGAPSWLSRPYEEMFKSNRDSPDFGNRPLSDSPGTVSGAYLKKPSEVTSPHRTNSSWQRAARQEQAENAGLCREKDRAGGLNKQEWIRRIGGERWTQETRISVVESRGLLTHPRNVQAGNAKTRPVDLPPAPAFTRHHTVARIPLPYPPKPASEPTSISSAGGYGRTGGQDRQLQRKDVVVRTPIEREAVPAARPGAGRGAASASTDARVKKQRRRSSPNPHRPGFECEQQVSESTPLERSRPALLHSPPSREPSILHSGAGLTPSRSALESPLTAGGRRRAAAAASRARMDPGEPSVKGRTQMYCPSHAPRCAGNASGTAEAVSAMCIHGRARRSCLHPQLGVFVPAASPATARALRCSSPHHQHRLSRIRASRNASPGKSHPNIGDVLVLVPIRPRTRNATRRQRIEPERHDLRARGNGHANEERRRSVRRRRAARRPILGVDELLAAREVTGKGMGCVCGRKAYEWSGCMELSGARAPGGAGKKETKDSTECGGVRRGSGGGAGMGKDKYNEEGVSRALALPQCPSWKERGWKGGRGVGCPSRGAAVYGDGAGGSCTERSTKQQGVRSPERAQQDSVCEIGSIPGACPPSVHPVYMLESPLQGAKTASSWRGTLSLTGYGGAAGGRCAERADPRMCALRVGSVKDGALRGTGASYGIRALALPASVRPGYVLESPLQGEKMASSWRGIPLNGYGGAAGGRRMERTDPRMCALRPRAVPVRGTRSWTWRGRRSWTCRGTRTGRGGRERGLERERSWGLIGMEGVQALARRKVSTEESRADVMYAPEVDARAVRLRHTDRVRCRLTSSAGAFVHESVAPIYVTTADGRAGSVVRARPYEAKERPSQRGWTAGHLCSEYCSWDRARQQSTSFPPKPTRYSYPGLAKDLQRESGTRWALAYDAITIFVVSLRLDGCG
ncbi:hypothetical protein B0H17DRAFT_1149256 [Mycena rosella]|uniref:Uncharacterized protein n=1 Tax=Mycena rosella TaxID=1033263 RepID=A0AAD7FTZ4_MYCRO|nr:hypothetical protein B0H17DRAFT_1149256 [Mycena rosella]